MLRLQIMCYHMGLCSQNLTLEPQKAGKVPNHWGFPSRPFTLLSQASCSTG